MTTISIDHGLTKYQPFLIYWLVRVASSQPNSSLQGLLTEAANASIHSKGVADSIERYKAAITAMGRNASRYRISSEALVRRVRKEGSIRSINRLVDANNTISLRTGWPVGCYDTQAVASSVLLRQGATGEHMLTLGKGEFDVSNLPVLADGAGPFGCAVSDSQRACTSDNTLEGLFVIYGFGSVDLEEAKSVIDRVISVGGFEYITAPEVVGP
ncbi:MAG: hypothetical protein JSR55_05805 [Proteobacteria bacterium]|nr:hypothetical protein [Pseudomonadota bacterium]